jgi:hypothetical protein
MSKPLINPTFEFIDENGKTFTVFSDNSSNHPSLLALYENEKRVEILDVHLYVTGEFTLHPISA